MTVILAVYFVLDGPAEIVAGFLKKGHPGWA